MAARSARDQRPWTFYILAALFGAYLLFLYSPMVVIADSVVSGPDRRRDLPDDRRIARLVLRHPPSRPDGQHPGVVLALTLARRRGEPRPPSSSRSRRGSPSAGTSTGAGVVFYLAVASLVMPSLLVGFGIGLASGFSASSRACSPRRSPPSSPGRCRSGCS